MNSNNKRQIKIAQKDISDLSFNTLHIADDLHLYIYKKFEKLSTAVVLVTSHLSERETLRNDLRSITLSFIKKSSLHFTTTAEENFVFYKPEKKSDFYNETTAVLIKIKSLLVIGRDSFVLNKNNCTVLIDVIDSLLQEVAHKNKSFSIFQNADTTESREAIEQTPIFSKEYFIIENPTSERMTTEPSSMSELHNSHSTTDTSSYGYKKNNTSQQETKTTESTQNTTRYADIKKQEKNNETKTSHTSKKNTKINRQNKILTIIKDKVSVGIKDIANEITECSEKTIQRELIAMLEDDLIVKEGERRWSMYSLK